MSDETPRREGSTGAVRGAVRRHPVWAFLLVAFGWAWAWDLLLYVALGPQGGPFFTPAIPRTWGLPIGAVAVTWACGESVRAWAGRVANPRLRPRWYLLALALPLVLNDANTIAAAALGGTVTLTDTPLALYAVSALWVALLAGGVEEFGWRGFAQHRLQERYSGVVAAVGIGLAWTLWHLPLFYPYELAAYETTLPFVVRYTFFVVTFSVVLGWLYNAAAGSVLPALVVHAIHDNPGVLEAAGDPSGLPRLALEYGTELAYLAVVVGLVVAYGRGLGAPPGDAPAPDSPAAGTPAAEGEA